MQNSALFISYIFSKMGNEHYNVDADDIKYGLDPEVTNAQFNLYINLIKMLGNGATYEEVAEYVDNYHDDDFDELLEDQKTYIKTKANRDINTRRKNIEGEDK